MKKFILGLILGLLIPAAAGYAYFRFGFAPVATDARPMPFEKQMARMALHARIEKEASQQSPIQPTEPNLTEGAHIYVDNCAMCHGWPGEKSTPVANGMFPKPPQLFVHTVTDDPVGETYWKVSNGIRMSGMPAFSKDLTETQRWQVSEMLANADKLPETTKGALAKPPATPAPAENQAPQQQEPARKKR